MRIDAGLHQFNGIANNMTEEESIGVDKQATLVMNQKTDIQHETIIVQTHSIEASNEAAISAHDSLVAYEDDVDRLSCILLKDTVPEEK